MVIKVYVSGISASKEVKKRQQRALLLLDSVQVEYEPIDITEPGREDERVIVQQTFKSRKDKVTPLPPQFFNDDHYCGDYEDFNSAVDIDQLFTFLKLEERKEPILRATTNGIEENQRLNNIEPDVNVVKSEEIKEEEKEKGEVDQNEVENQVNCEDENIETEPETKANLEDETIVTKRNEDEEEKHIDTIVDEEETAKRYKTNDDEEEEEEEEEEEDD